MTNSWTDIANADVVLAMGGNPAENHPVGFRLVLEARRRRGAKLVAVDVRFQRTAAVADHFVQIRPGTDIAFLAGLINYALQNGRYHEEYLRLYTNAPFLVREDFSFDERGSVLGLEG
jgi:formate dehydrogenase major subunit